MSHNTPVATTYILACGGHNTLTYMAAHMAVGLISKKYSKDISGVLQFGWWDAGVNQTVESILWGQLASNVSA